jgi:hypothetical protein
MDMIQCPHCLTRVFPSNNGECPSCRKPLEALLVDIAKPDAPPWTSELPEGRGETGAVTVARFIEPVAASLAKNCLEDAGIPAFLADVETVSTAWQLSNALGGIKLQVIGPDAARASGLLQEQLHHSTSEDTELAQEAVATKPVLGDSDDDLPLEDEEDEPEPEPTNREKSAERAFRGAVYGLLFFPLEFYASYLLLLILFSSEALAGRARRRAYIAAAINTPYMLILLGFVSTLLVGVFSEAIR